jgi:N-acetylglutamate synthase-like GNAT family acetyltransferase
MSEANELAAFFQMFRDELGFINTAQCREKTTVKISRDGQIVAGAICNHCVQKDQTTLYDIAVHENYRRNGFARNLIYQIAQDSPHDKIIAKCPVDLSANEFYQNTGWVKDKTQSGKKRDLNVYRFDINQIDVMTTGRSDLVDIAEENGLIRGSRLDHIKNHESNDHCVDFLDLHWEAPDFEKLLEKTKEHEPKYVIAGDYQDDNHEQINTRARRLREYAGHIIIVPHKNGDIEFCPSWSLIGYSTPTDYAGTDIPMWQYQQAMQPIHILGGTPHEQLDIIEYLGKAHVQSIDGNSIHKSATIGAKYWQDNDQKD